MKRQGLDWIGAITMIAVISTSCAKSQGLRLGAETSFDGLVEIANARASAAWIRPDFDLTPYSRVKLVGAGIEYRPVHRAGARREFPLSDGAKERLGRILHAAFQEELGRSQRFELTEETGPDVLLVWGGLLDVVSFVPPAASGRGDIFLQRIGEATLVVELRDSSSNATLARVLDRRAAERTSGTVMASHTVTNTAEVRRLARRWARLLRQRLDEAPTLRHGSVVEVPDE